MPTKRPDWTANSVRVEIGSASGPPWTLHTTQVLDEGLLYQAMAMVVRVASMELQEVPKWPHLIFATALR